ncbi:ESAT-6/WXG100 secretion system protein [Streptococcus sanguinis]|uniref:ESAT-6/WXG100 secretion system protein n=1 Tax=Streptococcus sanguinis TaxID=1305 RepID=A0AAJ5NP08_STRSA|nr:ESAT-6/WXG100 secretion system protein [Streptococcus sanguinis]
MTEVKRLELAQKMESLTFSEHNFKVPYIHPKNIFLQGSVVKILHFGFRRNYESYTLYFRDVSNELQGFGCLYSTTKNLILNY